MAWILIPTVAAVGAVVLAGRAAAVHREFVRTRATADEWAGDVRRAREQLELDRRSVAPQESRAAPERNR
ncbi:MAG: hypothetical protein ACKOBG_12730 [Actinomycetota bacterium]